jgi:hypothetical protein
MKNNISSYLRFEVLTAEKISIVVFCFVTPTKPHGFTTKKTTIDYISSSSWMLPLPGAIPVPCLQRWAG